MCLLIVMKSRLCSAATATATSVSRVLGSMISSSSVYLDIWVMVCCACGVVSVGGGVFDIGIMGLSVLSLLLSWGCITVVLEFRFFELLDWSVGSMLGLWE